MEQFEAIALAFGDGAGQRLAYNTGKLEIMTPLPEHEFLIDALADAVKDIGDEFDLNYVSYRSTTWRKQLKQVGVEPDDCFYIQNEPVIRGRSDISLDKDPPPDLVLEIDLTSKSLNRFPIYARLGVPEIWRYDEGSLAVYELGDNQTYQKRETSVALPGVPVGDLLRLIEQSRPQGKRATRKAIREWAMQFRQ